MVSGEAKVVQSAVAAAAGRGDGLHACTDTDLLQRSPAPPRAARAAVEAVRAELARAGAMSSTGAYDDALLSARTALTDAEAAGWAPIVARARLKVGELLERVAQYEDAEHTLEQTYFEALDANRITAVEASRYLDLRFDHFEKLRGELTSGAAGASAVDDGD